MYSQLAQKQYMNTQIATADRLKLVVMLYEGAISFIKQAKAKMERHDASGKGIFIGKALDIIAELNTSLNFKAGGEVAVSLSRIYNFLTFSLTKANFSWDTKALGDAIAILTRLRDAWEEVNRKFKQGEVAEYSGEDLPRPRTSLGSIIA